MAMIPCPKCGQSIHSEASACRFCGVTTAEASIPKKKKRSFNLHFIAGTMLAVIGALIFVAVANGNNVPPMLADLGPFLMIGGALWYIGARIWAALQ